MPRKKKVAPGSPQQYLHNGVKQFGDCRMWNDKNIGGYAKLVYVPVTMVGPCDIVDDVDPKQRYTFYLYNPSQSDDSARELDRLRRAGYFKCAAPRFISPTEKFETKDGVLVLGQGIWYALPKARLDAIRHRGRNDAVELIANTHADLAESAKAEGYEHVTAETRNDLRGQRTE